MLIDFRKKGRETDRQSDGETERETSIWERNIDRLPPTHSPTRDQNLNLGMCPHRGSSLQPFDVWNDAPTS